jgi:hypothetical protein
LLPYLFRPQGCHRLKTVAGVDQGSSSNPVGIGESNPNVADHPNEPALRECDEEPSAELDSAFASNDKESVDEPFAEAACGGDVAAARSLFKPHPLKNFFDCRAGQRLRWGRSVEEV